MGPLDPSPRSAAPCRCGRAASWTPRAGPAPFSRRRPVVRSRAARVRGQRAPASRPRRIPSRTPDRTTNKTPNKTTRRAPAHARSRQARPAPFEARAVLGARAARAGAMTSIAIAGTRRVRRPRARRTARAPRPARALAATVTAMNVSARMESTASAGRTPALPCLKTEVCLTNPPRRMADPMSRRPPHAAHRCQQSGRGRASGLGGSCRCREDSADRRRSPVRSAAAPEGQLVVP